MQHLRNLGLGSLIVLSVLSACAAADPPSATAAAAPQTPSAPSGVFADFLVGRFALAQSDPNAAAAAFLKALAGRPNDPDLVQQGFVACIMSGRPEAIQLAHQLPDDPVAQLLLADQDARSGNWASAEQRYRALPRQNVMQLLQPLLVAWSQVGTGHSDAALTTLRPFAEGPRFRGLFALHAGLIADLAGQTAEASRYYALALADMPAMNLRTAQVLASWDARSGHPAAAQRSFAALGAAAPDLTIALPSLEATSAARPVTQPTEGIAEAYLALAGALRAQDSPDYAMMLLRLALDLRPDLTAARLMAADILGSDQHNAAALLMLASVPRNDPLAGLVGMRRAAILAQTGRSDEALQELTHLAAVYPDSPLPPIQRGDILRAKERYNEAIAAYSAGIAKLGQPQAEDWPVFYDRGIAFQETHQWHKAELDFHRALQLSPDQPFVLNYLGYTWATKGEHLAEAQQMIQKASAQRPNDGAITDSLGWVMLRQGQVAQAVQILQRAVEQDPEDATINGHLGDAYMKAGRSLEAQYQWRRALTLNPGPEDTAKLEAKLQMPAASSVATSGRQ
ncbi:MAG TPA: tetratricopeptide repeat protein [Acetobacteraceae bacterium]|nr:tetratricopeptide repeat protein [Acetobacteraceae bacterium]